MNQNQLKSIIEAAIMSSEEPIGLNKMTSLFQDEELPSRDEIKEVLALLEIDYQDRGVVLQRVSSGYRFQAKDELSPWLSKLKEERPARYSRALMETIALIAYRQPITRAEIENVRGVSVSSNIIRTLHERNWIRVVGHRDVPGKPALYGTSKQFLDHFSLKSLDQLPTLAEIKDLGDLQPELDLQPAADKEKEIVEMAAEPQQQENLVEEELQDTDIHVEPEHLLIAQQPQDQSQHKPPNS